MLAVSSRLGPYEIVAPLDAGGMGEVYRARDTRLGREVAIKVIPELFANNLDRLALFEREAKAVAALSHPIILSIHDYGTHDATTYAVMELLEGETLRDRLAKGPMPWRDAVAVGAAIAEGLAAAHVKGIVFASESFLKCKSFIFFRCTDQFEVELFGATLRQTGNKRPAYIAIQRQNVVLQHISPFERMSVLSLRSETPSKAGVFFERKNKF